MRKATIKVHVITLCQLNELWETEAAQARCTIYRLCMGKYTLSL